MIKTVDEFMLKKLATWAIDMGEEFNIKFKV